MKKISLALAATLLAGAGIALWTPAKAGPEKVPFPVGYQSSYTKVGNIDRYDTKTIRIMYMNSVALSGEPDKPLPFGSVLLLEQRPARLGPDGNPLLDASGRFIPGDQIQMVAVQMKQQGWATEYPENIRNPNWEYAVFEGNGTLRANANLQPCMSCHKPRAADDHTFVAAQVIRDLKGKK